MKFKRLSFLSALCFLLCSCGTEKASESVDGDFGGGETVWREDYSEAAEGGDFESEACDAIPPDCIIPETQIQPQSGLLTGGEWNDNSNYDFWCNLISERQEWSGFPEYWQLNTCDRIAVTVTDDGQAAENVTIKLISGSTVMWQSVSDNKGRAYLFNQVDFNNQYIPAKLIAAQDGKILAEIEYSENTGSDVEIKLDGAEKPKKSLDLMFVIDTTGSMGDELAYIQTELNSIIARITEEKQVDVRLSVNFYRDTEDEYIVRSSDFTSDIDEAALVLNKQYASGGGDYPEAVEQALETAVQSSWQEESVKLMFLILDAPPHYSQEICDSLQNSLFTASAQGIRIIPVASSGVDTETEFLCRSFSLLTGGTYTFLTNHSGIGGDHLEPTVGYYQVEKLNDMIVRIIESYL